MPVSPDQIKQYRIIGHALKPVVMVAGNGLSPSVLAEVERALNDHELIKIKFALEEREERKTMIAELIVQSGAELIQTIGKIALIYRAARKPKVHISNIRMRKNLK